MVAMTRWQRGHTGPRAGRRHRLVTGACGIALLLVGCGRGGEETGEAAPAAEADLEVVVPAHAQTHVYHCANNLQFTLRVLPDTVWAVLPERTVRLPRDMNATYPRFSNGDMDFSMQGAEAQLETEDTQYTGCRRQ